MLGLAFVCVYLLLWIGVVGKSEEPEEAEEECECDGWYGTATACWCRLYCKKRRHGVCEAPPHLSACTALWRLSRQGCEGGLW